MTPSTGVILHIAIVTALEPLSVSSAKSREAAPLAEAVEKAVDKVVRLVSRG